ncbi:MAG: DUF4154 domain-containing protein [Candidatus Omnitrophica bacterium]|nr:DUF4154 domain-containing protein [Candidatus Omnitrophota bacterium]
MFINFPRLMGVFLAGCLFFCPVAAKAGDGVLPGEVFTAIMLKTLNYDRNIDRQAKEKVVIGIVCFSDDTNFAEQVKENISKVQASFLLKDKPVEGKLVVVDKVFDKVKFEEQLKQNNISVLVVAVSDSAFINNLLGVSRPMQISSVCRDPGCARNGVGLEISQKDSKPRMLVNMDSIKQEGSDYNSKFLAMCEVLK